MFDLQIFSSEAGSQTKKKINQKMNVNFDIK